MSARALVVYCVSDLAGESVYLPTVRAAITDAIDRCARYRAAGDAASVRFVEVQKITIPGPFNRDLVCRLLSSGGYASSVETVWRPADVERAIDAARADDAPLKIGGES